MLMIVLGAGASYDADPADRWAPAMVREAPEVRPPLARDLFELTRRGTFQQALAASPPAGTGSVAGLIQALDRVAAAGNSIESELERMALRAKDKKDLTSINDLLMLRFYLRWAIVKTTEQWLLYGGGGNHHALVYRLDAHRRETREEIAIVTFNYDRFVERALADVVGLGYLVDEDDFTNFTKYVDGRKGYRLFKLHGSIDWARAQELDAWDGNPEGLIGHPEMISALESAPLRTLVFNAELPLGCIPALAVPTLRKLQYECPPEHQAVLERILPEVTRVVTIGWSGGEQTFLDSLLEKAPLRAGTVVSGTSSSARDIADRINEGRSQPLFVASSADGFSQFLGDPAELDRAFNGHAS
jgi:hypothetical protein